MRYLSAPTIEAYEQAALPSQFGKAYAPHGDVTLRASVVLALAEGVDTVVLDGELLVIQPDTVAWVFLTRREEALLRDLSSGKPLSWLADHWPQDAFDSPERFVTRLFRRGLLSIDGHRSMDPTIFQDSHNIAEEGHLVELLITEKCNLACGYCLAGANQQMPHMSPEIARKTVDLAFAMQEAPSFTFEFSGGEPFLRFDLMQQVVGYILERARDDGRPAYICAQTNGTLFTPERVMWLKENNVQIGLSLDGHPESQNLSRPQVNGKESFSKVLAGLDLLQQAEIPFGVLVVLSRSNIGSAQGLIDFLVDNGISSVKLNPVAFLGTARQGWDEVGLSQEEVITYFQTFARLLVEQGHALVEANLHDMLRHVVSKRRPSRCLRGHCGAGDTFQTVVANGDIYPCGRSTQTPQLALGNVQSEAKSLSAAGRHNPYLRRIRERRPKTLEGCVSCFYRELCQAGCSAQAFERYGTVRHRTPECAFNKTMYPFLLRWLSFDEQAVHFFDRCGYFGQHGRDVELVCHPFLVDAYRA